MISRKQLSKNLYKLTKKEFPEIFGEETNDDTPEVDSLGWWSSIDEAIEYCESGENKRNALEYEKAYIALILTSRVYFLSTNFNSYPARFKE